MIEVQWPWDEFDAALWPDARSWWGVDVDLVVIWQWKFYRINRTSTRWAASLMSKVARIEVFGTLRLV